MNVWKNALAVTALLTASATAQRAARISERSLGPARTIGMVGDGFTSSILVFDANTDTVLGSVSLGFGNLTCYGDCVINSDLSRGYVVTVGSELWIVDLTTTPPSLAAGLNPVPLPTFGLDIALTPDERFLLVCGGNVPFQPLTVVDVATRTVVDEFVVRGIGVDASPDGSVLVADDSANRVLRLSIDSTGNLTNTGEFLAEVDPINVSFAPGGAVGLVVSWRTGLVRSFTVPGLAPIETLTTVAPGFTVCTVVEPSTNRIYVRKDFTLQAYSFDSATGDFGATPDWNVTPGFITTCYGVEQLALHPDGTKLYTTVAGGVQIRDPASGALLTTLTHPDLVAPSGLCIRGSAEVEEILVLDFETDDEGQPLVHGQHLDNGDPEFDGGSLYPVTITSSVNPSGIPTAAILNSSTGPAAQDPDLLVGTGNILILQTEANTSECPPGSGVYCSHNDDEDGGRLTFAFGAQVTPVSVVLIDMDASDGTSSVVLTDVAGTRRTYTVPANWTSDLVVDGPPGMGTLGLTMLADQPGFGSTSTASEEAGFDPHGVVQIDIFLGGSGGVDDLSWSASPPRASVLSRNGMGVNRVTLSSASLPMIGGFWRADLDCRDFGNGTATLYMCQSAASGTMTLFGEKLIAGAVLHRTSQASLGFVNQLTWRVPNELALIGLDVHVQGLCTSTVAPLGPKVLRARGGLSNALDLILGF